MLHDNVYNRVNWSKDRVPWTMIFNQLLVNEKFRIQNTENILDSWEDFINYTCKEAPGRYGYSMIEFLNNFYDAFMLPKNSDRIEELAQDILSKFGTRAALEELIAFHNDSISNEHSKLYQKIVHGYIGNLFIEVENQILKPLKNRLIGLKGKEDRNDYALIEKTINDIEKILDDAHKYQSIKKTVLTNIASTIQTNLITQDPASLGKDRSGLNKFGRSILNLFRYIFIYPAYKKYKKTGHGYLRVNSSKSHDIAKDAYKKLSKFKQENLTLKLAEKPRTVKIKIKNPTNTK